VFRLGMAFAGPNASTGLYGSNPSYVDLMQETFNRPEEKAILASLSYDFAGLGVDGLSAIVNFVAGFEGKVDRGRSDRQEVDLTIDYRVNEEGWLKSFWLRVRGSWYNDQSAQHDGTQVRVILRYDFPVI
jgi:outer membrane porin, OprD family